MNFLIVGDTSLAGRRLRARLSRKYPVQTAGRSAGADIAFDLADVKGRIPEVSPADVLIHCAASFRGNKLEDAIGNEVVNSIGALRVMQLAEAARCQHVIYISSLSIHAVPQNGYFGSYGLSKRHGQDNMEWACGRLNVRFTALVASQLYDEHGEARRHQAMLYHLIDCARLGRDIILFGSQDVERNLLFIDDLTMLVEACAEQRLTGVFTAAHPRNYRLSEIAELALKTFNQGGRITFDRTRPDVPSIYVPHDHTLYERLGLWPATDLKHGLALIRDVIARSGQS